jgi:uncharacterized protein YozE (UPF0346 family)
MNKISEKKIKEIIEDLRKYKSLNNKKHKASYYYQARQNIIDSNHPIELIKEFLDEYSKCKRNVSLTKEGVETDDRAITNVERDEEGLIKYYTFEIYRKDLPTLTGKLDRKEMETIYKLYSYYGANLTQKIVSREFPQYTFIEFKRILRAFNVYKATSEFAPHMVEEKTEKELINLHNQNKENNVLRRIEKDQLSEANKLINKLAKENLDYKTQLENFSTIKVDFGDFTSGLYIPGTQESNKSLIIHLSDLHIGSRCESNTLYPNKWDKEELERRLEVLADKIYEFGYLDTLIINLLGDNLDGMDNQTARRDHYMPQNMDNMEQVSTFIETMSKFILRIRNFANHIKIYSVKEGNHDGITGYVASLAFVNLIKSLCPEIECVLFKDFIGYYTFNGHQYLLCHGKDSKFMKKPLPLTLDDKSKIMIYEWLEANNIHDDNIHFIKGDLHSNALNSCRRFDYRNVLSLYGASDYSNYNFSRNSYGVSYDLFIGNSRTIGTFENF